MATATVVNRQPRARGVNDVVKEVLRNRLWGITSLAVALFLWWAVVEIFKPQELLFPGPAAVVREFIGAYEDGLIWPAVSSSLYAVAVGLALALLVGVPAGLFIGMSPTADLLTSPYLWGFFAMPRIAMAPLMVLWFGFGDTTKIWLVFLSAVVPIILNCKEGVQTIDESLLRAAKSFGANRLDTFRKVVAPATVPSIATGVRNGISRGFVGLLVIELTVGSGGIGTQVMRSMRLFNTGRMFAFAILLVVIALVLISISRRLEVYANRWREEVAI